MAFAATIGDAAALDLQPVRHLILEGKASEAYALLQPYEFDLAGNAEFDYLLGLAALNSGRADKASLIFERVLAVDPLFAAARIDMGRAYFSLGDMVRARAEFVRAQALNPPPAARATIRQYLAAIEATEKKTAPRFSGYIEVSAGHDTNANNATEQSRIVVPALVDATFTLNATNVKTADSYAGLAAGGEAVFPIAENWSLYAGGDMRNRNNRSHSEFDFSSLDGRTGLEYGKDAEQFRGGMIFGQFYFDGKTNRVYDGFSGEWRHTYNERNQAMVFGQYARYRYPDPALKANGSNQSLAGIGWIHVFADTNTGLFGSIYGGEDRDTDLRADGDKHIKGMRLFFQTPAWKNADLFMAGGIQKGGYDRLNSAFLIYRDDTLTDLSIGLVYHLDKGWVARPQASFIKNQSNIAINQYDRTDISLTLRRDFR